MILMNLLVALVAGLILFEPFARTPMSRSVRFSDHRNRARAFAQAGVALVAAMIVATSNPAPQQVSPCSCSAAQQCWVWLASIGHCVAGAC
jgi:hypothetical protein